MHNAKFLALEFSSHKVASRARHKAGLRRKLKTPRLRGFAAPIGATLRENVESVESVGSVGSVGAHGADGTDGTDGTVSQLFSGKDSPIGSVESNNENNLITNKTTLWFSWW